METILIDQFIVPEAVVEEFLRHVHFSTSVVRARTGFVEGNVYRRAAGDGRVNVVTTAAWVSEGAMEEAKHSIQHEFAQIGFNPAEIMKHLGVQIERGIYHRAPY
jgi:hypothetical protein